MWKLITLLAALALASCSRNEPVVDRSPTASTAKDPAAAKKMIEAGAVIVDVRTAEEFSDGHLPNAVNVPVQELPNRLAEVEKLVGGDRDKPIVVYCAAGGRAAKAKAQLDAAGYTRVINGGGYDDLH
jgi:phage shock protein E